MNGPNIPLGPLPPVLTPASWNANKGTIAKMAGETGIGDALTELDHAWKAVDWDAVDPSSAQRKFRGRPSLADLRDMHDVAGDQAQELKTVLAKLKAVEDRAKLIEQKWRKPLNPIPAKSRRHVADIAAEAANERSRILKVEKNWSEVINRAERSHQAMVEESLRNIRPYIKAIKELGATVLHTPTRANYGVNARGQAVSNGFHDKLRGLSGGLDRSGVPQLSDWNDKHFVKFVQNRWIPQADDEVAPKAREVLFAIDKLEAILKKID